MLRIESISFSAGSKNILEDISATFEGGRIHGIIGPNGAGKSTLFKVICRIWEPRCGSVLIHGKNYRTFSRRRLSRSITWVPQHTVIHFPISVYDMVAMGRHPHNNRFRSLTKKDRDAIERAMRICDVHHLKNRPVNELSGGESKLTAIARALTTGAEFILLDEPTSQLDIRHVLAVMVLMEDLKKEGKTVLVALHDLNLARNHCDTITMIHNGRIFFSGPPAMAFIPENFQKVFGVEMSATTNGEKTYLDFATLPNQTRGVKQ